jgi:uncharacterized protein YcbK (DUF882 family)
MDTSLITTTIQGSLQNSLFNKLIALNLNINNSTLKAIVSRVAELSAPAIVQQVAGSANFHINDIPKNIIGNINPVNIVSGNLNSTGLQNNLSGIIQFQLSSQTTDKVVSALEGQLKLILPKDKLGLINFAGIAATLTQSLTPSINAAISTALKGVTDSIFSRNIEPKATINNITSLFSSQDPAAAQINVDQQFDNSLANKALQESRNFDIYSAENNEKLAVLKTGFTDPNANYPTKEYAGVSETNKLAQGDPKGTVVQEKNNKRMLGAKLPNGNAWDQPESAYRGAYPYNKVTQTESGHIIEIDDTPGAERLHIYHRSGTFVEIDNNGSIVKRAVGSSYEIIDRNGKIAIAGRADISINGACNIYVGNDANIEVDGDTNITCHNDITAQAGGTFNLSAVEEFNIASGNINIEAYHTLNQKATTLNLHSSENMHMLSNADIKVQAINLYDKLSGSVYTQAEGTINSKAAGENRVEGNAVYFNSGKAEDSTPSVIADGANIGVISGRKDVQDNSLDDPLALSLADNKSLLLEEETSTEEDITAQHNLVISQGFASASDLDASATSLDSSNISSEQTQFVEPNAELKKATQLPGNYNLSPNFTVEMLSSKAAVTRDPIRAHSISYGQIVYNLQGIALNVLEPVKKLYPNMFVSSAFRDPGNASNAKTSQHPLGQGVDIQFRGANKKDYYEIAQKLARVLKYDQLILEFCNYTNNPWVHVSYSVDRNRTQVLTFFNHKKHSDGLSQLA